MDNPFRPPDEDGGSRWERLVSLLERKQNKRSEEIVGKSRQLLEWAEMPYFQAFMGYLQEQADKPVDTSNDAAMRAGTIRCNVYKEIRRSLTSEIEHAKRALDE